MPASLRVAICAALRRPAQRRDQPLPGTLGAFSFGGSDITRGVARRHKGLGQRMGVRLGIRPVRLQIIGELQRSPVGGALQTAFSRPLNGLEIEVTYPFARP